MGDQFPHLLFGYGSLMCPDSRTITVPTVADRTVLPVSIRGVERRWSKPSSKMCVTSIGVEFQPDTHCVGVLIPVTTVELERLDQREVRYDRYELQLDEITPIPHLLNDDSIYQNTLFDPTAVESERRIKSDNDKNDDNTAKIPQVWIYVTKNPVPASSTNPIAQSYVDIVLRGCLTISQQFAQEFITTTKGWHPAELCQDSLSSSSRKINDRTDDDSSTITSTTTISTSSSSFWDGEDGEERGWWVDDRRDPLYIRADMEYSLRQSQMLDVLLQTNLKNDQFQKRITRGRQQVLRLQSPPRQ